MRISHLTYTGLRALALNMSPPTKPATPVNKAARAVLTQRAKVNYMLRMLQVPVINYHTYGDNLVLTPEMRENVDANIALRIGLRHTLNLRLPTETLHNLQTAAARTDSTVSRVVRRVLTDALDHVFGPRDVTLPPSQPWQVPTPEQRAVIDRNVQRIRQTRVHLR